MSAMMASPLKKSDPITIVGAGAFGLSTAWHLSNKGYTNISIFEKDETIPSRWSAANDLNKIVRAEYEDDFYTELTMEAIKAWQTPLFAPYFHRTGFLHVCSSAAPPKAVDTLNRFRAAAEKHPTMKLYCSDLDGAQSVRDLPNAWQLDGPMPGWKGYFNAFDGYAHSGAALQGLAKSVLAKGVRFHLGANIGAVDHIEYSAETADKTATGIRTKDGQLHASNLIIVAVGSAATSIVPQLGTTVVAKSWSVAHVRLSDEETAALRGIPVTYARDLGFLFEPDPATNLLKICPMGGGYINSESDGVSRRPSLAESAILPAEDEWRIRELLRHCLPSLADRPLVQKSLCWFADTSDSDFIVDYVPQTRDSVLLLSGDSGHGFKMFPIVGEWVSDVLESESGKQEVKRWRWKEPRKESEAADWGGDVSWRLGETREFKEIAAPRARL